jgi:hypothetical protein
MSTEEKDSKLATAVDDTSSPSISKDELTELVRAIKFAKPEASQRQVYQEITQDIPKRFPQFAFLAHVGGDEDAAPVVHFNDVRKVWKKATQQQPVNAASSCETVTSENSDLLAKLKELNIATPQMFTVGDTTKRVDSQQASSSVAREYMMQFLQDKASEQASQQEQHEAQLQDYVHVFLNVPADTTGARPHQAVINFQSSGKKKEAKSSGKKTKGKKKVAETTSAPKPVPNAPFEDALIVKIQMAAALNDMDTVKYPMLVYDESRKLQTFIHCHPTARTGEYSDSNDTIAADDGYLKVARWIDAQGKGGVLGNMGGTKAYFYARLTSVDKKKAAAMEDILSIYIKELAPPQEW